MRKSMIAAVLAAALTAGTAVTLTTASATEDKETICHAAGLAGTTKYVELTISVNAIYGPGGHFNENGTPQAGHEDDYKGECEVEGCVPNDVAAATKEPPATVPCPPEETTTTPTTEEPTTTTAPPLVCTGDPATDPSGCPIDDCALPPGNRPAECDPPAPPAPPAVPVPDEPTLAG